MIFLWNHYTEALGDEHIHLLDKEDELVWDFDPSGEYTPRSGYIHLSVDVFNKEVKWWWRHL